MVRIGINPLTWSNDDMPELGAETPLETCLAEAKQAGYIGIELGNKFPRTAKKLCPILAHYGLLPISGWYGSRLLERNVEIEMAAAEPHIALLTEIGCGVIVFADVSGSVHGERDAPLSHRPVLDEAQWALLSGRLSDMGRRLASRGVRLAYHHHIGTVIQDEAEIDRLMALTGPEVGLLLDTGHLAFAGGDPIAIARRHATRVAHVHCKDVRADNVAAARRENMSFLDAVLAGVFTVPGDGSVDFATVLASLSASGYEGWLVVEAEQDPAKAHPLTYARMGFANLSRLARASGLLG